MAGTNSYSMKSKVTLWGCQYHWPTLLNCCTNYIFPTIYSNCCSKEIDIFPQPPCKYFHSIRDCDEGESQEKTKTASKLSQERGERVKEHLKIQRHCKDGVCFVIKSTSSSYSVYFDTGQSPKAISSTGAWSAVADLLLIILYSL